MTHSCRGADQPHDLAHASCTGPRVTRAALFAVGACLPLASVAELSNDLLLGPGLRSRPAYDGSDERRTELVPVLRWFGPHAFARSTQGVAEAGLRAELAPGLHIGTQLAYEGGRITSQSDFLESHNLPNIRRGASIGLHMEWDQKVGPVPLTLLARARQNLDSDLGAQADLRLSAGLFRGGPVALGLMTQFTWANAKSTGAFYGITPQQSVATGLPAFGARSGLLFSSLGLLWSVDLSPSWVIVGSAESRRLHGDAAHSPLTQRHSNHYVNAGVAYRF